MSDDGHDPFPCTDLGNSERLVAWHGDDLRHVPAWGWVVWTGRVWKRDDKLATRRAKDTVRRIYRSAMECPDEHRRKALSQHAVNSESRHRIAAMLALAESDPKIAADVDDFDRDPWVLNVRNGTIDLKTGQLRQHRRDDLLSKLVPLEYRPDARSELWDTFIRDATDGQDGLDTFLRRAAGYTITGLVSEDALFLPHGPAGTGKSTFVETLRMALGPYAGAIRIEVLTTTGHAGGGHNEDIARLVGLRMVTAVEASDNERLREGQVKHMTGGDTIPASLKHKPGFDFRPVLKLWLATNDVPYIRSDDSGMWRRVHKMPFEHHHGKSGLRDQLQRPEHLAAVLAWSVRGCLEWQRDGLQPPACIGAATEHLRQRMDGGFERFLQERCELGDDWSWTLTKTIRAEYTRWCAEADIPAARRIGDARVAALLRQHGCEDERRRPAGPDSDLERGWWGIRFNSARDTCDASDGHSEFSETSYTREKKLRPGVTGVTGVTNGKASYPAPNPNVCPQCGRDTRGLDYCIAGHPVNREAI